MRSLKKSPLVFSWEGAVTAACGWYKTRGTEEMPTPTVMELCEDRVSEASKRCMVGSRT